MPTRSNKPWPPTRYGANTKMSPPAAIVFDLDGTLIDSAPDVRAALNRLLAEEGRPQLSLPQVQELVGEGAIPLIQRAWAATGAATTDDDAPILVERYLAHYRAHPADHTVVYNGVVDELRRLSEAGIKLGICTNKPHQMTLLALQVLGLDQWFSAVLGGDFPRRKPDGEHIHATLRLMGADHMNAVMVGDSITDVKAGHNAGLKVIAVTYGYRRMPAEDLGADYLIDHFAQLPQALAEWAK